MEATTVTRIVIKNIEIEITETRQERNDDKLYALIQKFAEHLLVRWNDDVKPDGYDPDEESSSLPIAPVTIPPMGQVTFQTSPALTSDIFAPVRIGLHCQQSEHLTGMYLVCLTVGDKPQIAPDPTFPLGTPLEVFTHMPAVGFDDVTTEEPLVFTVRNHTTEVRTLEGVVFGHLLNDSSSEEPQPAH